jgi:orotate phosphoribosyltransferase
MTIPDRQAVARRIHSVSQLSGSFKLRSGAVSDTYFDKFLFESDPNLLRDIAILMAELIPAQTEIVAGLEMGGIPVVTVLSQISGIPSAFLRKEPKSYGTCKYAEGPALENKNVALIEDVVSSGGAILDSLARLRADDIEPTCAVCVIDRQTGGRENLAEQGLELHCVFRMDEIIG